ncbi:unnamed protein product [Moneuplotes crassus]|uniref:C2 domain-containing protein n=1 Tax=Euplotes crassus TaxID=5936 RepID=A0AAD1XQ54_EUPCR|nr:unnamed protein product [Moneuplotes crassus]
MHSITHKSAIMTCILDPPDLVDRSDVRFFKVFLYYIGKTQDVVRNREELFANATEPVWTQVLENQRFDAYEFTGLDPSSVYKCKAQIHMKDLSNGEDDGRSVGEIFELEEMVFNTTTEPLLDEPLFDENFSLYSSRNLEDQFDRSSDLYNFQVKHLRPPLCESEKVLKDFSHPFGMPGETEEEIREKRKQINSELLAARGTKDWKEFINQSYKYTPHTREGRQKRVDRLLMISNAIDAFDEIPNVPRYAGDDPKKSRHFLKNDWFMGPFYSYDVNYLNKD